MKDLVLHILTAIVDHTEDIVVEETGSDERMLITIKVNQEDIGKVIGRQGRIIHAIRDLVKLRAAKEHRYVDVELLEDTPVVPKN